LQTAGYGGLEYERGFTIYIKSDGELNLRPQLFPKCFITTLSLAKAPSWVNSSGSTVKAIVAAAHIMPHAYTWTKIDGSR